VTSPSKIPQLSFNGGEIPPELQGRLDLAKYSTGVNFAINFIIKDYGGLERRPGFVYRGSPKEADSGGRLIPFIFNDQQAYVCEFGDEYVRFWMLGGQIKTISPDQVYEITSPFFFGDLWRIQYAQSADVMWLTHQSYQIQTLTREAHSDWTMADWESDTGPFLDPNITAITMTPAAVTGSTTLTASAAYFHADMVGALFRIEEGDTNAYSMWEPAKSYALNDVVRYSGNVYICTDAGTSGVVAPVHLDGKRYDGQITTACEWDFLHSGYGVCRVTGYTSTTVVDITVLSRLPSTAAVLNWREGAFSNYRGWPTAVALSGERLWFASTPTQPQTVWGSRLGAFDDFTPGANADDAVTFTIVAREANPIRTMAERKGLYLATSRRVYRVTGSGGGPIKPDDILVTALTSKGSNGVQPVDVDRAILLVDQSGKRVQEIGYQVEADDEAARDLNKLAPHILRPGH
jgi:hypothetical protein